MCISCKYDPVISHSSEWIKRILIRFQNYNGRYKAPDADTVVGSCTFQVSIVVRPICLHIAVTTGYYDVGIDAIDGLNSLIHL